MRRGPRIAENVVGIDARIAVGMQLLVDEPRRDRDAVVRLEQPRNPRTCLRPRIGRAVDGAVRAVRVDPSGQRVVVADEADRRAVAGREIDRSLHVAADAAVRDGRAVDRERPFGHTQPRLRRDVARAYRRSTLIRTRCPAARAALRCGRGQRGRDPGKQRDRNRRLVEVNTGLGLHSGLVADHLACTDAADCDLTLAWAEVGDREPGNVVSDVDEAAGAACADLVGGLRRDRERHVLERGLALRRRDHDLVKLAGLRGLGRRRERDH